MKLAKLLCISAFLCVFSNLIVAQAAPNLENGWKAYGSYDGSHLDTVNVMNGNLMFHGPLTPDPPQRGSIKVSNVLYSSSKDWQAICTNPPNSGMVCNWQKGGAGVIIIPTPGLSVHRTRNNSFFGGQGTSTSAAAGDTLVTADQAPHQLYGAAGTAD
ncbi:MAG TPA: hypothetical protein VLA83_16450, partial [Candidatus Binatia bacterium]|nr:hypothetical protein [Candidatus Binatia bacterium]